MMIYAYFKDYWASKDHVLQTEQVLLRAIAYELDARHPHHFVLHFVRELEGRYDLMMPITL